MAILLPGKFLFLAHPHTASSSMVLAFQDIFPNAYDLRPHHMTLNDVRGKQGAIRIEQISQQRTRIFHHRGKRLPDGSVRPRSTPEEIRKLVTGNEVRFTVIRNPYDYFASRYVRLDKKEPFESFCRGYSASPYIEGGKIYYHLPDSQRILRYENLQTELNALMKELELPEVPLGQHNPTQGKKPWESYYSPEAFAFVNERFGEEFERFYEKRTS